MIPLIVCCICLFITTCFAIIDNNSKDKEIAQLQKELYPYLYKKHTKEHYKLLKSATKNNKTGVIYAPPVDYVDCSCPIHFKRQR